MENLESDLTIARASIATLTAERDQLKAQLGDATKASETNLALLNERTKERDAMASENDALKTKLGEFNKTVAAEVARLGINAKAAPIYQTGQDGLTATERCMAAKL